MKFLILVCFALIGAASAEVLHNSADVSAAIVKQSQDVSPDGAYAYSYETDNGIYQAENGAPVVTDPKSLPVVVAQGQYQYTAPDGTPITVTYTADQNGFQPHGEHIPAISPLIQRALEYIRAHPQPEKTH